VKRALPPLPGWALLEEECRRVVQPADAQWRLDQPYRTIGPSDHLVALADGPPRAWRTAPGGRQGDESARRARPCATTTGRSLAGGHLPDSSAVSADELGPYLGSIGMMQFLQDGERPLPILDGNGSVAGVAVMVAEMR
jgi:hypothetical protein